MQLPSLFSLSVSYATHRPVSIATDNNSTLSVRIQHLKNTQTEHSVRYSFMFLGLMFILNK